ncbi:MAG: excinuclease ABC subunit UvrC, partial [Candidatus Acidiferrales bacterium]
IQGSDTVASMVLWEDGKMKKSGYRKFIVSEERRNDDFASMSETVERRYRRLIAEKRPLPSLILIDGGLGQLNAAAQALERLEIINQPIASIAKKEEIIYIYGREDEPIILDRHSPLLHLVQQIRDETHRFAVTFHRQRRKRRQLHTQLVEIPGVGQRSAEKLLRRFGSVSHLRELTPEELSVAVPAAQARRVFEYFHKNGGDEPKSTPAAPDSDFMNPKALKPRPS